PQVGARPCHRRCSIFGDIGVVVREMMIEMHLAASRRLQIFSKSLLVPIACPIRLTRALVQFANSLMQVWPAAVGRDALQYVDGFAVSVLGAEQFGKIFTDQPISRIGRIRALVTSARLIVIAVRESQEASLYFKPRIGPHLLRGQFVSGFAVKAVSSVDIAH